MCAEDPPPRKDLYAVLGISPNADPGEIRTAYRRLARKYHPDVNAGDAQATVKFQEIGEAYEWLSDPAKRVKFDQVNHIVKNTPVAAGQSSRPHYEPNLADMGDLAPFAQLFEFDFLNRGTQSESDIQYEGLLRSFHHEVTVKKTSPFEAASEIMGRVRNNPALFARRNAFYLEVIGKLAEDSAKNIIQFLTPFHASSSDLQHTKEYYLRFISNAKDMASLESIVLAGLAHGLYPDAHFPVGFGNSKTTHYELIDGKKSADSLLISDKLASLIEKRASTLAGKYMPVETVLASAVKRAYSPFSPDYFRGGRSMSSGGVASNADIAVRLILENYNRMIATGMITDSETLQMFQVIKEQVEAYANDRTLMKLVEQVEAEVQGSCLRKALPH